MKVVHAELQSSVVFHNTEITGATTLDAKTDRPKGISMEWKPDGLYLMTPKLKAQGVIGFIPAANVKCLRFEPDTIDGSNKKLKAL